MPLNRVLICFLCTILCHDICRAGGFSITSMGSRRMGMGTVVARPDDGTAVMHNAAGLADQPGTRVHVSGGARFFDLSFRMHALDERRFPDINPNGCEAAGSCPWPVENGVYARDTKPERYFGLAPYLGASTDLGFLGKENVVVALAAYAPNFYGAELPQDGPSAYQAIDGMFVVGALTTAVGWRMNPSLAFGASLAYHQMHFNARRRLSLVDALTARGEEPNFITTAAQTEVGDLIYGFEGVDHGVGWSMGILYTPVDWLALGFQYNGATQPKFEGDLAFSYARNQGHGQSVRQIASEMGYKLPKRSSVEMVYPHAVQGGLCWLPNSRIELGIDARLWFYNLYEEQRIVPHYDANESGDEPLSADMLSSDKDYGLSYDVSGGLLVRPFRDVPLEVMGGCGYDHSPVPDRTFSLDNPAMSSVYCGTGVRYATSGGLRVSLSYIYVDYIDRNITESEAWPPINGSGRGSTHIPGAEVEYVF